MSWQAIHRCSAIRTSVGRQMYEPRAIVTFTETVSQTPVLTHDSPLSRPTSRPKNNAGNIRWLLKCSLPQAEINF